jgi:hypothetical protein
LPGPPSRIWREAERQPAVHRIRQPADVDGGGLLEPAVVAAFALAADVTGHLRGDGFGLELRQAPVGGVAYQVACHRDAGLGRRGQVRAGHGLAQLARLFLVDRTDLGRRFRRLEGGDVVPRHGLAIGGAADVRVADGQVDEEEGQQAEHEHQPERRDIAHAAA